MNTSHKVKYSLIISSIDKANIIKCIISTYACFVIFNFFADYGLTELDYCAHSIIEDSPEDIILVKIDEISIKQRNLVCLLDINGWLDDEVSNPY